MSQTSWIFAALLIGFIVFITVKGQLPSWGALFLTSSTTSGTASTTSTSSTSAANPLSGTGSSGSPFLGVL